MAYDQPTGDAIKLDDGITPGTVHDSFNDANADITLSSCEGIAFRVQSTILSFASGWFRTMFTLPTRHSPLEESKPSTKPDTIPMAEAARTLAAVLAIINWQPMPEFTSLDYIEDVLRAGEKYEIPCVVSVIRLAVMSPILLEKCPIRIYAISSARGWVLEAKQASARTIGLDLLSSAYLKDLSMVNSECLTRLMLLHRRRRDAFRAALDYHGVGSCFVNEEAGKCRICGESVPHAQWTRAKHKWCDTIEKSPAEIASKAFLRREETVKLLDTLCEHCGSKLYLSQVTLDNLSLIVDELPMMIEVCLLMLGLSSNLLSFAPICVQM